MDKKNYSDLPYLSGLNWGMLKGSYAQSDEDFAEALFPQYNTIEMLL
jgi:hypothetical protein